MSDKLYRPDPLEDNSTSDVGELPDQYGMDLVSHFMLYGATEPELEALNQEQIATLQMAGLLC